ncbi:hypothetical protein L1987_20127 [Smallanthus sonchifolius]|uniref:Uncharacterized protein n=1 Tax=Smallanthus sonchifolius TaxID=185202 RepID=A0ACB9ISS6_9ASTR|nr:hypothetical protein L1987_20127 [Smallanthus sonchifolius]
MSYGLPWRVMKLLFSEDTIRRFLQFRDLATDPTAYPDYFMNGCWRQRMGYVGVRDYSSYKKMWVLDQWRYFAHVMIMCISSRKAGKDAMEHDLATAMVGLSLNKGYNFSRYIFKALNDQINTIESHLINEAYVAPDDWRWFGHDSEPELSEHSNEQQEEEDVENVDESSEGGDEEAGNDGAEGSDSRTKKRKYQQTKGDRLQQDIPRVVEVSVQQQIQVSAITPDVAVTSITEEVPVIVTLPVPSVIMAVTTPILIESVTITPSITPTTIIPSTIPTTTTEPISQPYNYGDFTQGFDFDTIFSSPLHNAEASTSRNPDPNDARIDTLEA